METAVSSGAPSRTRSRTGCGPCRFRKVKCDENPSGCHNCTRLGFRCSLPADATTPSSNGDVVPKKRVRQACRECREQKLRCSASTPRCERCRSKNLQCTYEPKKRKIVAREHTDGSETSEHSAAAAAEEDPGRSLRNCTPIPQDGPVKPPSIPGVVEISKLILQQHIDAFFQYVHRAGPFNFIHRGSLMRTFHKGKMARSLLLAIAGVASRYMDLDHRDFKGCPRKSLPGPSWANQAERDVIRDLDLISIPKLQIVLILIFDRAASGRLSAAWFLASLASRIAYGLRLNYPTDAVPFTNQECRRRLMWCVFCVDKEIAASESAPPLCPRELMHVQLPCNSQSFELELECETTSLDDMARDPLNLTSSLGVTAYLIRLIDLQDRITTYLRRLLRDGNQSWPWNGDTMFWDLRRELVDFAAGLPPEMQGVERAMYIRANTPESDVYIMVQSRLHTCWCRLLGAFWLDNQAAFSDAAPPEDFLAICRTEAVQHAQALSQFWIKFQSVQMLSQRFLVTDWGISRCVFENTRTLIGGWKSDKELFGEEASRVEEPLTANLELLGPLAAVSPYVASWRNEILRLIRDSSHAHILRNRADEQESAPPDKKPKLFAEDVLVEARRLEDARFPNPKRGQPLNRASPAVRREAISPADAHPGYSPASASPPVTNVTDALLVPSHPHFAPSPYPPGTNLVPSDVPSMMTAPAPTWGHPSSVQNVPSVPLLPSNIAFFAESLYGEDGSMGDGNSTFLDAQALLPFYSNTPQGPSHEHSVLPGGTWGLPTN